MKISISSSSSTSNSAKFLRQHCNKSTKLKYLNISDYFSFVKGMKAFYQASLFFSALNLEQVNQIEIFYHMVAARLCKSWKVFAITSLVLFNDAV